MPRPIETSPPLARFAKWALSAGLLILVLPSLAGAAPSMEQLEATGHYIVDFDPVWFSIGPFDLRWYALSYIAGLVLGWQYIQYLLRKDRLWAMASAPEPFPRETVHYKVFGIGFALPRLSFSKKVRRQFGVNKPAVPIDIDDLLIWATLGVIIGGRLGFIFLYAMWYDHTRAIYLENPLRMLALWDGGMAFHGGLIGVILAIVIFCKRRGLDMIRVGDLAAVATPIGLFFGRLANFINGELWGKKTDAAWGMIFMSEVRRDIELGIVRPAADYIRHPSQLYEGILEGLVLFLVLWAAIHKFKIFRRPGLAIGIFLAGYGLGRFIVEFYRESEAYVFYEGHWFTVGMLLCIPMMIAGGAFIAYALRRDPVRPMSEGEMKAFEARLGDAKADKA